MEIKNLKEEEIIDNVSEKYSYFYFLVISLYCPRKFREQHHINNNQRTIINKNIRFIKSTRNIKIYNKQRRINFPFTKILRVFFFSRRQRKC